MSGGSSSEVPGTFPVTPKPDKPISSRIRSKSRGRPLFPPKTPSPSRSPTPSPPPGPERSESPEPTTMSKEHTTSKIEPKLAGQSNYAEWILSIKQTLRLYDHSEDSIWDIVIGEVTDPFGGNVIKAEKSVTGKTNRQ